MIDERLRPRVEYGGDAELGAEMTRVVRESLERGRDGLEEDRIAARGLVRMSPFSSWGTVKTRWKYGIGRSSACCASRQAAWASDSHLGQWRFRHEL